MKKIYQEVEVEITTLQAQDAILASGDGYSGTAGDLEWLGGSK